MILLIFLLFLVPSAWADETALCVDHHGVQHNGCYYTLENCVENVCERKMIPLDPCLAKMEAAMRAMSPYINSYDMVTGITYSSIYKGAPNDVMKLWNNAKACWRTR